MASGSFEFSASGYLQGKINWSSISNGSDANSSNVTATLYARRTNSATTTGRSWSGYVKIGSAQTNINFSSSVSVSNSWVEMASVTTTIYHNNDGFGSTNVSGSVKGPDGTALANNTSSGSQTVTLDTIPRYFTNWGETLVPLLNTATVSWTTAENCSAIKYGFNSSSLTETSVSGKSGTFTLTGLNPETNYTFYINFKRADSNLYNRNNDTVYFTTKTIAKLNSVPNVNIGSSQTITWTAPTGTNATFNLALCKTNNTSIINYGTVTGTSKTVTPTANTIYALTPNSNTYTARYILTTTANGISYTHSKDFVFTVTNSNPSFSNFTYQDTNSNTTALTGSNQILVNGYSNVSATISTSNKAIANNSATMSSYTMSIGSKSTNPVAYSSSSAVTLSLSSINSGTIVVAAKDSRGNSKTVTKNATFKNYSPLIINSVTATRENNGVGQAVTLSFNGTYWNSSFGSVANSVKSIKYYYKATTASSWTTGTTALSVSTSGSNWSGSASIKGDLGAEGFNISNAYDIKLTASDELVTKTYIVTISSGTPAIAISKNRVAIGQQYNLSLANYRLQVNGNNYINGDNAIVGKSYLAQKVRNRQGSYVEHFNAGAGTNGYTKICTLIIGGPYVNQPIIFGVIQRGRYGRIILQFKPSSDIKPDGFNIFQSSGSINPYIVRTGDSTWDLYIQKSEAYDDIEITELYKGEYQNAITITWKNEIATSLPSGAINSDWEEYGINAIYTTNLVNRYSSRPTSANVTTNGDGGLYTFKATSSMTTGKPSADGHIINFSWDNTGGWDSQLAILDGAYPKIELRGMNNGTWTTWRGIEARTVLYNNTSGATGTITLNDSAANYSFLRIYAMTSSENYRVSVDIYSPNGKTAYLLGGWQSGTNINYKSACVSISGTSITKASNGFFAIGNGGSATVNDANVILILRVDGYK